MGYIRLASETSFLIVSSHHYFSKFYSHICVFLFQADTRVEAANRKMEQALAELAKKEKWVHNGCEFKSLWQGQSFLQLHHSSKAIWHEDIISKWRHIKNICFTSHRKFESTMDELQSDIDNLEREKADTKKRLDAYSKKSLLQDLARHASSSSSIAAVVAGIVYFGLSKRQAKLQILCFN